MGGSKTEIQQAPTTPAPSAGESAADLYKARLQYDRPIAQQEQQLAEEFYPQQAALQSALYSQYAPQMAGIQEQLRQQYSPTQMAVTEEVAQQGMQRLQSPYGYTPEQQQAVDAIRLRQQQDLQEQLRTRANLGGGLYGGRAGATEQRALTELGQSFAQQDIDRQMQGAQLALQYATPSLQQLYPQVSYPGQVPLQGTPQQSVTPDANALYNAMFQASQPQNFMVPGTPGGVSLGILGQWGGR
ncbi:hypothetical protein KKF61_07965 [Patescibacteria group bacterium]|nr:hypothetical protein [Patescibacteria group bacterium]